MVGSRHHGASASKMPGRVLVITPVFPPAQVAEADHVLHECLHLAGRGREVHVLTTASAEVATPASLHVHAVMPDWGWGQLIRLLREIRSVGADATILYFLGTLFNYSTMVLFVPLLARLLRPGSTVLTQFSNIGRGAPGDGSLSSVLKRALFRMLGPLRLGTLLVASHHIVVLSEVYRRRLEEYPLSAGAVKRSVVIPPPPLLPMANDPDSARKRARMRLDLAQDETVIAFFGRLYPRKGIEALIEAGERLRADGRPLRVVLIGGFMSAELFWTMHATYEEELRAFIATHGGDDTVRLTGEYRWDSIEGSEYLFASDIVVLPLQKGVHFYNSSFAAACAHGRPVVATRGRPPESRIQHGRNVFEIAEPSADLIEAALRQILDDPQLRARLASGAEELAAEVFHWDAATDRLLGLLDAYPRTVQRPAPKRQSPVA